MGGTIALESDEGAGAEFTIQIPFPVLADSALATADGFLQGNILRGIRVVVCPVHRTLRAAIARKLAAWECEASFLEARPGSTALLPPRTVVLLIFPGVCAWVLFRPLTHSPQHTAGARH